MPDPVPSQTLTLDHFKPRLGERFQLFAPTEELAAGELAAGAPASEPGESPLCELELVEADGLTGPASEMRSPFSLVFHGPAEPFLPQQIYRLDHPQIRELTLFLVPLGPHGDGMRYEAVFT
jgi:hypothetical protein